MPITKTKPDDIAAELRQIGFEFAYNECTNAIEVNGSQMNDGIEAELRYTARMRNIHNMGALTDTFVALAYRSRYHPIRTYLSQCLAASNRKADHISQLASHLRDSDGVFAVWLRKWLIGAVAKVIRAEQNPMLVLDGAQGIGKSEFARWLCTDPTYFIEAAITPEDKDCYARLASKFIWEVAELGATIKRADREALKHFITMRQVTVRPPYGHHDLNRPAMASLIGTVNNESGLLNDPTGSRRFLVCHIDAIDWSYSKLDIQQVWAEAYAAFLGGESWLLSAAEMQHAAQINERYDVDDPIESILVQDFEIDPAHNDDWWMTSIEIMLHVFGTQASALNRMNAAALGTVMTRLGVSRVARRVNNKRVWGYAGIRSLTSGVSGVVP